MNTTTTFHRPLGRSGIQVSALGLGCWAIGGPWKFLDIQAGWGDVDDAESIRAIHAGLDHGVNFLDTAANYGTGRSESVLAQALAGRRDQVIIATKFGYNVDETAKRVSNYDDHPATHVRAECEASLRRLNTDYIDLYQFHINEYPADQAEPVRDVLEALVAEGKIRAYGWSTDFPASARLFAKGEHCAAIQVAMNVVEDSPEIVAICEESDLAAINRGPLAMGLLSGKYTANSTFASNDIRGPGSPGWMKYFKDGKPNPEWLAILDSLRDILTSGGRTLAQGALAWLWARTEKTIPIPGFRTVAQVEDNAGALRFGPLTPDQMQQIDRILGR